jgi:glutathione S-transferase
MMIFPIESLEAKGLFDEYPNIKLWFDKMKARPAYKRAEEKGGANDLGVFTR